MSLRCTVRCSICDKTIPMRNDLPHRGRYRTCCSGCGAAIIFGANSLRWCYEPAPHASPVVPAPRSLSRRRPHPRWTGSHASAASVKGMRTISA